MLFFHRNKRKKDCPHLLGDSFCIFWILSRQVIFTQLITLELPYARADCGPYSTDMMPVLLMHPFLAELSPNPIPHYPATFLGLFNPKHSALHVLLLSLSLPFLLLDTSSTYYLSKMSSQRQFPLQFFSLVVLTLCCEAITRCLLRGS